MLKRIATAIACSLLLAPNAHATRAVICDGGNVSSWGDFASGDACAESCVKPRCGGVLMDRVWTPPAPTPNWGKGGTIDACSTNRGHDHMCNPNANLGFWIPNDPGHDLCFYDGNCAGRSSSPPFPDRTLSRFDSARDE